MDYGQFSALLVLVGIVLVAFFAQYMNEDRLHAALRAPSWKRGLAYFGAGVLFFGLASCVVVASGISVSF